MIGNGQSITISNFSSFLSNEVYDSECILSNSENKTIPGFCTSNFLSNRIEDKYELSAGKRQREAANIPYTPTISRTLSNFPTPRLKAIKKEIQQRYKLNSAFSSPKTQKKTLKEKTGIYSTEGWRSDHFMNYPDLNIRPKREFIRTNDEKYSQSYQTRNINRRKEYLEQLANRSLALEDSPLKSNSYAVFDRKARSVVEHGSPLRQHIEDIKIRREIELISPEPVYKPATRDPFVNLTEERLTQESLADASVSAEVIGMMKRIIHEKRQLESFGTKFVLHLNSSLLNFFRCLKQGTTAKYMTKRDFHNLLRSQGVDLHPRARDLFFDLVDIGKDGMICYNDFEKRFVPSLPNLTRLSRRVRNQEFVQLCQFDRNCIDNFQKMLAAYSRIFMLSYNIKESHFRELSCLKKQSGKKFVKLNFLTSGNLTATKDEEAFLRLLFL